MSENIQIRCENAPSPAGPYSQAIVAGDFVFVAGQRPADPATGAIPDTIQGQTEQVIRNIRSILAEAGCTLADVVRSTVYLSDIGNFAAMNEIYRQYFSEPFPARTTISCTLRGILIEIDVIAHKQSKD